jgi:glycine cleavage system aminomethyltransferase T
MIYHRYLSDLTKADLTKLKYYDIFYTCHDSAVGRIIAECMVLKVNPKSLVITETLLRNWQGECKIFLGNKTVRLKTIEKYSYLNY